MIYTCLSCHYSEHNGIELWCKKRDIAARWKCKIFVYEPGTDE